MGAEWRKSPFPLTRNVTFQLGLVGARKAGGLLLLVVGWELRREVFDLSHPTWSEAPIKLTVE